MYTSVYPGFQTNPTDVRSSKLIIHGTGVHGSISYKANQYIDLQLQKINYQAYICKQTKRWLLNAIYWQINDEIVHSCIFVVNQEVIQDIIGMTVDLIEQHL